jgi:hypothetical protein
MMGIFMRSFGKSKSNIRHLQRVPDSMSKAILIWTNLAAVDRRSRLTLCCVGLPVPDSQGPAQLTVMPEVLLSHSHSLDPHSIVLMAKSLVDDVAASGPKPGEDGNAFIYDLSLVFFSC